MVHHDDEEIRGEHYRRLRAAIILLPCLAEKCFGVLEATGNAAGAADTVMNVPEVFQLNGVMRLRKAISV